MFSYCKFFFGDILFGGCEYYLPHMDAIIDYLKMQDGTGLAVELEILLYDEFKIGVTQLKGLGISGVTSLMMPDMGK